MQRPPAARRVPAPHFRLERLEARDVPATFTWDGGGTTDNWSDGANWAGDVAPTGSAVTLDDLVFPAGAARLANTNDIVGGVFASIQFTGGGYTLSGSPLTIGTAVVAGFVTADAGTAGNTVALAVTLGAAAGADQVFTVGGAADLAVSGAVGGATGARLVKAGTGTLTLSGNNSAFTGPIQVSAGGGVLVASGDPNALGSAAAGTTVLAGGQLALLNLTGSLAEPLTLTGTGVTTDGALVNAAGANIVSGPIMLAADASIGVAVAADQLILNGGVGGVGAAGLTKVGSGSLRLNSPGGYAGVTAVAAGTLVVTSPTALGVADGTAATGTTVAAGAALVVDGVSVGTEALTVGDGTGAGEFNFRSTAAWAGPVTLANSLTTGVGTSASDALTLTGAIDGPGALTKTGNGRLTLAGTTGNTHGGVTTADDGFLFLAKTGGAVAIPAAGLVVTGDAFVQYQQGDQIADTAPVRVTNGTRLDLDTFSDTIGPLTLGATTGSDVAFVTTAGAGTLRLNGDVTREVSAAMPGAAQIIGRLDLNGATRTITVADSAAATELFIPAAIVNSGGAAGFTKAGAGTLQLSNSTVNTYTGATTVLGGTLELNKSAAGATAVPGALVVGPGATVSSFAANLIADAAQVTVGAGATFFLNGDPETIAGLSVSGGTVTIAGTGVLTVGGPVTLQNATVTSGTLALGGDVTVLAGGVTTVTSRIDLSGATRTFDVADAAAGADLTLANVIQSTGGAAGLTKTGAGTLTLGAANTYTGTTAVTAGVLRVVGSVATSPVALAGGTLTGSGSVGVVTATGGTLTPGLAGPTVILTTPGVALGAGSTFAPVIDAGGSMADLLRVNGTVNLTGATLSPTLIGTPPTGTLSFLLIANDGTDPVVGTFAGLPQGAMLTLGGVPFAVQYNGNDGNDVVLVPVMSPPPPPSSGTLGPVRPVAVGGATDGSVRLVTAAGQNVTASPFGNTGTATRTAMADVDGDGTADLVAVTGPGTPLRVAVLSGATGQFLVQPFDPFGGDFTGGGYVAAGDLDRDGRAEFVVTPDQGGGPRVSIFGRAADGTRTTRANFLGIDDASFRGGARAALGDVDNDGTPDVVVAAGFGGGPRAAIFGGTTVLAGNPTRIVADFFAFPGADAVNLRNGAFVAAGDVTGDGFADLVFGGGPGGAPRVFILSGALISAGNVAGAQANPVANFFVANDLNDRGGARVAVTNSDGDAKADVAVGSGAGQPARVRLYLGKNFTTGGEPATFQDLTPLGNVVLTDGVFVG